MIKRGFIWLQLCIGLHKANARQPIFIAVTKDSCIFLDSLQQLPQNVQQVILKTGPSQKMNGQILYAIKGCYLYKQQLFLPVSSKQQNKLAKPLPDACLGNFISLTGIACSSSGCFTGLGSGACSGMLVSKKAVPITVIFLVKHIK